ncbi:MAG: hypothetical protein ABIH66_13115, partial [bacterium]
ALRRPLRGAPPSHPTLLPLTITGIIFIVEGSILLQRKGSLSIQRRQDKPSKEDIGFDIGRIVVEPGSGLSVGYNLSSVYMFCCSQVEFPSQKQANDFGYDDYYEITNPNRFLRTIADNIADYLKTIYKPNAFVRGLSRNVEYKDKKEREVLTQESLSEKRRGVYGSYYFIKSETSLDDPTVSFMSNNEYRFVWIPICNKTNEIIKIEQDPIFIDASRLLPFVKQVS